MVKAKSFIEKFYVAFIGFPPVCAVTCAYLSAHLTILNQEPFGAASLLHWYTDLFQNEEVLSAVRTSLLLTTLGGFNRYIDWNTCAVLE